MTTPSKDVKQQSRGALLVASMVFAVILCVIVGGAGVAFAYQKTYTNKMFPGAEIFGLKVAGQTKAEARKTIETAIDSELSHGLHFVYQGHDVSLSAASDPTNPDGSHDLVHYDVDTAIDQAYALGRQTSSVQNALTELRMRMSPIDVRPTVALDRETISAEVQDALKEVLRTPVDASFVIDGTLHPAVINVTTEHDGERLDLDPALESLQTQAYALHFSPIPVFSHSVKATLTSADVKPLVSKAEEIANRPPLTFTYKEQSFTASSSLIGSWIDVTSTGGSLDVGIDPQRFSDSLHALAGSIEQPSKNGSLVVKDGKITSFVSGEDGIAINASGTLAEVLSGWPASSTFQLVTNIAPGKLEGEDPEKLGITDLLGVGHSNFAGSPPNRIKNIEHGAALVNGSIIQPGETFSLLKTLGPVDGAHNWLTELVILGNKTKPDYGGGLCQIGTTTFRGALAAGLPIVERQNHSYRVHYYEPAGTDATIFEPAPDFKFLNDTANPVLINAYLKGNDAYFEFWGKSDGRKAEQTTPTIFNTVPAPPMKITPTLDLPVGKKKCSEVAHAGADTAFTYTVTYPSGEVKQTVFHSHYKPWQAVCLIGVDKLPETASSTDVVVPAP